MERAEREYDYVAIKALEDGVQILGMTRGQDTKLHHAEKVDAGEVVLAQFTDNVSAIKIRGRAMLYTRYGQIECGSL